MIELAVEIEAGAWADDVERSAQRAADATLAVLRHPSAHAGESRRPAAGLLDPGLRREEDLTATLLLTDDDAVRELNRAWRGQDKPTNVLSFPAPPQPARRGAPRHLGDIVLAHETVAREASREGKPVSDHVSHLVVHGLLHLLGHDHEADRDALLMERIETEILARLGVPDPHGTAAEPELAPVS